MLLSSDSSKDSSQISSFSSSLACCNPIYLVKARSIAGSKVNIL